MVDTSDIPESDEAWFKAAKLRLPSHGLDLARDGIAVLERKMIGLDGFVSYLAGCPTYPNHVRQGKPPAPLGSSPWMCHDMADVVRAPGLLEEALRFTPFASQHLGQEAVIYSLNAFYTEPTDTPKADIQAWHRDADDVRFLVLFVYCTDIVAPEDGAHQFKRGTHLPGVEEGEVATVLGERGTMFLESGCGYHQGLVPLKARRMLAWARWGVSGYPVAYGWDKHAPVPRAELGDRFPIDETLRRSLRLMVA